MYSVELYVKIRRAVMVEGRSEREVARYFGVHRQTVKKMCQYATPPGYRRKSEPVSRKLALPSRASLIPFWKLTNKFMPSNAMLLCVSWRGYVKNMALLVAIPSYVIMSTKLRYGRKKYSCHWHTCRVMRRLILVKPMAISVAS